MHAAHRAHALLLKGRASSTRLTYVLHMVHAQCALLMRVTYVLHPVLLQTCSGGALHCNKSSCTAGGPAEALQNKSCKWCLEEVRALSQVVQAVGIIKNVTKWVSKPYQVECVC